MAEPHLIVGLGNPGPEYEQTRHNIGFHAVARLAERWGGTWSAEKKFKARLSRVEVDGKSVHLCQPQTFMNLSGEAVGAICDYFRITPATVLAVVDDTELALGANRLRSEGSAGGHNGLRSLEQHLATTAFARLRIGVGRPAEARQPLSDHVLGRFTAPETARLKPVLDRVARQCECWLQHGANRAMNEFNGKLEFPEEQNETDET